MTITVKKIQFLQPFHILGNYNVVSNGDLKYPKSCSEKAVSFPFVFRIALWEGAVAAQDRRKASSAVRDGENKEIALKIALADSIHTFSPTTENLYSGDPLK